EVFGGGTHDAASITFTGVCWEDITADEGGRAVLVVEITDAQEADALVSQVSAGFIPDDEGHILPAQRAIPGFLIVHREDWVGVAITLPRSISLVTQQSEVGGFYFAERQSLPREHQRTTTGRTSRNSS